MTWLLLLKILSIVSPLLMLSSVYWVLTHTDSRTKWYRRKNAWGDWVDEIYSEHKPFKGYERSVYFAYTSALFFTVVFVVSFSTFLFLTK